MTEHLAVTRERLADFQQKTTDDPILQQLKETIELGPPETRKAIPSEIRPFYSYRDELTVLGEILFRANRVIVLAAMISEMLKKIHACRHRGQPSASKGNPILAWNDCSYQGPCLCLRNTHFISHGTTQRPPHATESN